jgi:hypothetical protein
MWSTKVSDGVPCPPRGVEAVLLIYQGAPHQRTPEPQFEPFKYRCRQRRVRPWWGEWGPSSKVAKECPVIPGVSSHCRKCPMVAEAVEDGVHIMEGHLHRNWNH